MNDIYNVLNKLGILYEKHEHPAVFTVADAVKYYVKIDGAHNKSIFLRNKKADKYYLILTLDSKRVNLKELQIFLTESKLSFASPEKLMEYLGLTPGSVSPFGLINDKNKIVEVIVDEELLKFDKQGFHPNINTVTLIITTEDLKKFLEWTKNKVIYRRL